MNCPECADEMEWSVGLPATQYDEAEADGWSCPCGHFIAESRWEREIVAAEASEYR